MTEVWFQKNDRGFFFLNSNNVINNFNFKKTQFQNSFQFNL